MGNYAQLKLDVKLKPMDEIGPDIHKLLGLLFETEEHIGSVAIVDRPASFFPDHPFWREERFDRLGDGGYEPKYEEGDIEAGSYEHPLLKIRCSVKYGITAVHNFLDWLAPYVDSVLAVGDYHYDDDDYELVKTEVTFEIDADAVKRFLFTEYYDRDGGWSGRWKEEKRHWAYRFPPRG